MRLLRDNLANWGAHRMHTASTAKSNIVLAACRPCSLIGQLDHDLALAVLLEVSNDLIDLFLPFQLG